MFDVVAKHKRIVQIILALITLPFAFFGVDYYFRRGDAEGEVATFDGGRVTQADFANALRDQQEMLRRTQRAVDPALFDNPEVRYSILQNVIRERLIEKKGGMVTLVGFGTFYVGRRAARTGRNPQTGMEINIKAARVPKFRPGKALKDAVN